MKSSLFLFLSTFVLIVNAQEKSFNVGLTQSFAAGGLLGSKTSVFFQNTKLVYGAYFIKKREILPDNKDILTKNYQLAATIGYDITNHNQTTITISTGLCYGLAEKQSMVDVSTGTAPLYERRNNPYNYFGVPIILNLDWYFSKYVGLNLYCGVTAQRYQDASYGMGLIFGYFENRNDINKLK